MSEPPEMMHSSEISEEWMGYHLKNRQGISFSLRDEFTVTLRIFYDDDFAQRFGSNSRDE